MMRKPIIAGNWKMNKTPSEAVELAKGILAGQDERFDEVDVVICPTFPCLVPVYDVIKDSNIALGAQNLHWEESGAYTGEISADMLLDAGCEYVIVGHSERRTYFGETNETVNKRLKTALAKGLKPIMCIGETLDERESGKTKDKVKTQIIGGFEDLTKEQVSQIIIAYEPIWAIGTGKTASPEQAEEVHKYIRQLLEEEYDKELAQHLRIQYGGSVKPKNVTSLMEQPNLDGALVGGASLKADSFLKLIHFK
jgi:triosephosphate isomerase